MGFFDRFRKSTRDPRPVGNAVEAEPALGQVPHATPEPPDPAEAPALTESAPEQISSEPTSWFARLKRGLDKTAKLLQTDVRDLFKREGELLDSAFLDRLYALMIRTDMGVEASSAIRDEIGERFRGRVVPMEEMLDVIREKLVQLTDQPEAPIAFAESGPSVVMVVGVNGSGKTTSIAKLAHLLRSQGRSVVLGAGDTFRAAATEQLTVWANRIGAEIVTGGQGADPASVAHRAVARAIELDADVCIVDTAGRLQTQVNLMEQLSKIRRVISKLIPEAPHEVLLVLDATAGQNGLSQAKGFSDAAQCTGIVLAKLDGTAKGGVVIPIRQRFGLPVKFIGVGEQPSDLVTFDARQFVQALFDGLLLPA